MHRNDGQFQNNDPLSHLDKEGKHGMAKEAVEWLVFDMVLNQCTRLLYIHAAATSSLCLTYLQEQRTGRKITWARSCRVVSLSQWGGCGGAVHVMALGGTGGSVEGAGMSDVRLLAAHLLPVYLMHPIVNTLRG